MVFSGKFVCATRELNTYQKHTPAPLFRKSFTLASQPEKAEITICGLGFYRLWVNGADITKGLLAPYISNSDHIVYYDNYDVADYLREGENVIGVMLGNGMQDCAGGEIWDFDKAAFRSSAKFALCFETPELSFEASDGFVTAPGPIFFNDLRCGCFYDARKEIAGWNLPGFDASGWTPALDAQTPKGEARLCDAEPIKITREIRPLSIKKSSLAPFKLDKRVAKETAFGYGEERLEGFLYDFGVNAAGVVRLKIKAERGRVINLQFGEELTPDGRLDYSNIRFYPDGYAQRDIYIARGEGEEVFVPDFTYHGFRYCLVSGITEEEAVPELLTYLVANSALETRASFACSDDMANRLFEATHRSDLANFYYFPTDCPHREKNGWTGDASLSAEHMLLTLTPERSFREWMRSIVKAMRPDGSIPGIIPTGDWGYAWGNGPAWDAVLVNIPYYTYRFTGDDSILKENAKAIFRYLVYAAGKRKPNGLVEYGLGDWCPVGRRSTDYKVPLEFTDSVTIYDISRKAADIFGLLGKGPERAYALTLASELRAAIRKAHIDFSTMTVSANCQSGQAMALFYGIFEPEERPAAAQRLLAQIAEHDGHIDFGVLGARVLFHALTDLGESDLAFTLITRRDFPSYGYMIDNGATSIWEKFQQLPADHGSSNHHFFGDISNWFIRCIAGICVNDALTSPDHIDLRPHFISGLSFAKAEYISPAGKLSVKWERREGGIELEVSCRQGHRGVISLPKGCAFKDGNTQAPLAEGRYQVIGK